jgi:hypothetical protein
VAPSTELAMNYNVRIMERRGLLLAGLLVIIVGAACSSLSTTTKCSTLPACAATGSKRLGQAVLTPQGATFLQGKINNGVLGIQLRDGPTGLAYSMFVGHPRGQASCPGTVIDLSPSRRFCYGRSTTALMAQFTTGKLLYTVAVSLPSPGATGAQASPASDQDVVTRIVSSMQ